MSIVSNLSQEKAVKSQFKLPVKALGENGLEIAKNIILATKITKYNINRAVTHNKGILNGIVAVANAIGQDIRAIEASCHAYPYYAKRSYRSLT